MYNQELTELAADVLGAEALDREERVELPPAALARQLDRGRHHRRPQEHHRRARPRPAEAAVSARQGCERLLRQSQSSLALSAPRSRLDTHPPHAAPPPAQTS